MAPSRGGVASAAGVAGVDALRAALLAWFDEGHRTLPWRGAGSPYAILVAEVMSQQTRAEVAARYFERWMVRFPTVHALASAEVDEVLTLWQGLGYYARARALHAAAREVVDHHAGHLPNTAAALRAIRGIGPYTAGAVASIAYGEPIAAVDGNVLRVLARITAEPGDIGRTATRLRIGAVAERLVQDARPGAVNEALMELGARVCVPRAPRCGLCPLTPHCAARRTGTERGLPAKTPRPAPRAELWVAVCVFAGARVYVERTSAALLHGLWAPPIALIEDVALASSRAAGLAPWAGAPPSACGRVVHRFTHLLRTVEVLRVEVSDPARAPPDGRWVAPEPSDVPLSTFARKLIARAR